MDLGLAVAPYLGAWIETFEETQQVQEKIVAPYLGAWIETKQRGPDLRSKPLCFFIILVIDIPF